MTANTSSGRVVIAGASGFMGRYLAGKYRAEGRECVTVSRSGADVTWDNPDELARAVDGADLVVGLAGKSVDCRYTARNRAEILSSRVETTAALSRAISRADAPPRLWANASSATIYRHAEDRPMTESDGEIGTGFSVDVARAWEATLYRDELPGTRRVALRTSIVLGDGGVLTPVRALARIGLGGTQLDGWWPVGRARREAGTAHLPGARGGRQKYSWIHMLDAAGILDFLEDRPDLDGPINLAAPHPVDNRTFMAEVRRALGVPFGPPVPRFLLEIGAIGMRTELELLMKSRWVLPERLTRAGYDFRYPRLAPALAAALG